MTEITARNVYYPHARVHPPIGGKSLTKQAFKEETDINNILRKHEKGLLVDHVNVHQGDYGDFTNAPDYHTALNRINEAQEMFMTIPAEVRANFDNDPGKFLHFAQNPANLEQMREMGLANPDTTPGLDTASTAPSEPPTQPEAPPETPNPAPGN